MNNRITHDLIQGVCLVAELFAGCIVARVRVGRIVSNFHIFESIPLSDGFVGLHGWK